MPSGASAGPRVLVVDDDPDLLRVFEKAFVRSGLDPVVHDTFEGARGALQIGTFDALVTDVRLGAYNGLQLAIVAQAHHPSIRIIVLSGFDDPVLRGEAERLGATFYPKPVSVSLLLWELAGGGTDAG